MVESDRLSALAARYGIGETLTRHILVVDDEAGNLDVVQAFLSDSYIVHTALSAEYALLIVDKIRCDVVIADHRMSGMTGTGLLAALRERQPDVAGVLMTAYTDTPVLVEAINRAGVFRYLRKPWEPEELLAVVAAASALVRRRRLNERLLDVLAVRDDDLKVLLDQPGE